MAHFSEIRTDNNEVIRTVVINDNDIAPFGEDSAEAEQWVSENIKETVGYMTMFLMVIIQKHIGKEILTIQDIINI